MSLAWITWYHVINENAVTFMFEYISALIFVMYLFVNLLNEDDLGLAAILVSFAGMIAPLEQISPALKETNHRYIDINIMTACFFSGVVWFSYGFLYKNNYIMIPNTFGVLFCTFQIAIWCWAKGWLPSPCFSWLSKSLSNETNVII